MKSLEIKGTDNLQQLEKALTALSESQAGEEIRIHLARNLKMHLFKESRVVALLATAAQQGRLVVKDWHNEWRPDDIPNYFRRSLGGFAATVYATHVTNDRAAEPSFGLKSIHEEVVRDGGILEPYNVSDQGLELVGKSLTFCAIDPEFAEPLTLAGLANEKSKFVNQFVALKNTYLEQKRSDGTEDLFAGTSFAETPDHTLAAYVFELYQNGFEHGRLSADDKELPGLRFISIRKHVAVSRDALFSYASGFPQLEEYLRHRTTVSPSLRFYEVSVSDQGLGMLRRFLAKRPEFSAEAASPEAKLRLLRRLLLESLTSKKGYPGAGFGLERALTAIRALNGFVTLRTDSFWLYSSFADAQAAESPLQEVLSSTQLARVAGTHFNALIPLREP